MEVNIGNYLFVKPLILLKHLYICLFAWYQKELKKQQEENPVPFPQSVVVLQPVLFPVIEEEKEDDNRCSFDIFVVVFIEIKSMLLLQLTFYFVEFICQLFGIHFFS